MRVTVTLDQEDLKHYIHHTEEELVGEITVDGFRKGKAPRELVKQHVDPSALLQRALERAMEGSLSELIAEKKLDVYQASDLKVNKNTAESLNYEVTLQVFPKFVLPELKEIKVERRPVEVTDAEIDEAIQVVRNSRSSFLEKSGPAAQGDRVEVDFEVSLDGKVIEGGQSKNHPVIIGAKNFIPGFEEQLVGLNPAETKTFDLNAPAEYYHDKLAGKNLHFNVTMQKVQTVVVPELSDQFAQSLGSFENIDQLKGNIREGIYEEKQKKEQQRVRAAILEAVLAKVNFELPEGLVVDQLEMMIQQFDANLHQRGMELGMYLAKLSKTQEDLRKEWRPEAERQAKMEVLVDHVAKEKSISASREEVEGALAEAVESLVARDGAALEKIDMDRLRNAVAKRLTHDKTLDFIEGVCSGPI